MKPSIEDIKDIGLVILILAAFIAASYLETLL